MKTSDFYYHLPQELIAQMPVTPRDHSRLLVYDKTQDKVYHRHFYEITDYLRAGDLLVLNSTKVLPVRLFGQKRESGAKIEFLLLKRLNLTDWEILLRPAKRVKEGTVIDFDKDLSAQILCRHDDVFWARFTFEGVFEQILERIGKMPTPPYIKTELKDNSEYNTVYAKVPGSAAAPTAGLHFTESLLEKIKGMGVEIAEIVLDVGLGTFLPVKAKDIQNHKMHSESYYVSSEAANAINRAKAGGQRIIAAGTTTVRTLESAADTQGKVKAGAGVTDIFIYPGYNFKTVDALITNFHLPESTLIMLVSAFLGREKTLELYNMAVEQKYRFFSFGDAMFLF